MLDLGLSTFSDSGLLSSAVGASTSASALRFRESSSFSLVPVAASTSLLVDAGSGAATGFPFLVLTGS